MSELSPQPNVASAVEAEINPRLWGAVVLTGLGAGLTSGALMLLLRAVQHVSYAYRRGDFLDAVRLVPGERRFIVMAIAGVVAAAALYLLRRLSTTPAPDVATAIWSACGNFRTAPALAKSLLSIVIVGMGAAVGREAALKDCGAVVAAKLADWTRLTPQQRRLLVACGAGAGMAAAYNVPLGGALFAAEVLLGSISITNILATITAAFVAVAVSWLMLPNLPTFQVDLLSVSPSLLLWAALAGPLLGAISAGYVRFIRWAETGRPRHWLAILMPIAVFSALGAVSTVFPEVLGNGKGVVQEAFASRLGLGLLAWLLLLRPLATALCLKSGAPGGLFTPTMTFGALLGALFGEAWSQLAPHAAKDSYAIIGAGAMLAAASQGPVSSIVFMLELTNHTDALIVPLMIAAAGATVTARQLSVHSIYSVRD